MTLLRSAFAALAVTGSLLVPPAPAEAVDAFVTVGTGVIGPGLPTTGCWSDQYFYYGSMLTVAAGDHAGTYWFQLDGRSSICESLMASQGSGYISGDLSGDLNYTRTGGVLQMSGTIRFGPEDPVGSQVVFSWCDWAPTSFNPVQSYAMACRLVLA